MNIETIAEHSVCIELLPPMAKVLDLGARGFLFTNEMERLGHEVFAVDIDKLETDRAYYQVAISNYDGWAGVQTDKDPQATRIKEGKDVPCYTLESFSLACGIELWDCIKIDIEGAEHQVIMSLKKAPAKQISCEFHLHTGIYTQKEVDEMVDRLKSLGYEVASHELTSQHGAGFNYWSSLFILKQ